MVPGIDEVSLALVADAWSRTYRSRAVTFAGSADAVSMDEVTVDIRRRDSERLEAQVQGGLLAGRDKLHVAPRPEPLVTSAPRRSTA